MSSERAMRASGWVPYAELAELEAQLQQANETIVQLRKDVQVANACVVQACTTSELELRAQLQQANETIARMKKGYDIFTAASETIRRL